MLIALYIRDAAGLDSAGHPALCPWAPKIRPSDHANLMSEVGGSAPCRTEWEAWWEQLLKAHPQMAPEVAPPGFRAFGNSPALRRVLQAHFGSALTWARERRAEYAPRGRTGGQRRAAAAGRHGGGPAAGGGPRLAGLHLTIIELPLTNRGPGTWSRTRSS